MGGAWPLRQPAVVLPSSQLRTVVYQNTVSASLKSSLALLSRALAVTVGPGDVMLSFGAFPAEVPARVRFLHPLHNFSICSYDPRQLSEEVGWLAWGGWRRGVCRRSQLLCFVLLFLRPPVAT